MDTQERPAAVQRSLNRRGFLQAAAGGLAGIAGVLALRQPPAVAQERTLTMLSFNHFVPQSDEELKKQAAAFSKTRKVKVTVDTIAGPQLPAKLAAEVQTSVGHDIVVVGGSAPYLYKRQLVNLDDLAEELGARDGGWY